MTNFKLLKITLITMLIFISMFPAFTNHCKAESKEIYVNESYFGYSTGTAEKPYTKIQEAIDAASNGDTIYIFGGLYQEKILINKQLKIVGSIDEIETIIDYKYDYRYVIEITADEVTLEYVTVSDSDYTTTSPIGALIFLKSDNNRINNNKIKNSTSYGIYVHPNSADNLISSNEINNTKIGVYISSSINNDVVKNEISNCSEYGILTEYSTGTNRLYGNNITSGDAGIYVQNSNNINITNNTIEKSEFYSIYLANSINSIINMNKIKDSISDGIYLKSSDCIVRNNTIENNVRGILVYGNNNFIINNTLKKQSASGIYAQIGTNLNILYLNKFIKNGKSAQDLGKNQWFNDSKGNYWSDYNYIDKDLDGLGDAYYSKNGVVDKYPLGYFLKPPNKPDNPTPEDFEDGVGLTITLKVHVEDPDSDKLTVYFYRGNDDTLIQSNSPNPVKYVLNDTEVQCLFYLGYNTVFTWYVIVDDGLLQNKSDPFIFSTRKTPPDNDPPIAIAGGPYFTQVGDLVQFDSTGSYDPDGTIAFYRWNFGDGSSEILEENPTHIYENPMEFQVTLTIIDNDGSSTSSNTFVSVGTQENDPPVAKMTFVETARIGDQVFFDSSQTYDPDGDNLIYLWDFGNGQNSTIDSPVYKYKSRGSYEVTLTVTDGEYTDTATGIITIKAKKSSGSPGFELLFLIFAMIIFFIIKKRKL